jgi:hypothetical protein
MTVSLKAVSTTLGDDRQTTNTTVLFAVNAAKKQWPRLSFPRKPSVFDGGARERTAKNNGQ